MIISSKVNILNAFISLNLQILNILVNSFLMGYADLAKVYFPNTTIVIDKYHFIRYMTWAIEKCP